MLSDRMKEIRAGIEFSESKIVLIVTRDHQDNTPGSWGLGSRCRRVDR
jgi:hypothetical protein